MIAKAALKLYASTSNPRNRPCKTSLKLEVRPQEVEVHSAISRWKHIGIHVEVVVSCSQYADIYGSAEIREEYLDLLSRRQQTHELSFQECSEDTYLPPGQ